MTERYTPFPKFEADKVCIALSASARRVRDFNHGVGTSITLNNDRAMLEVFPAAGVARITTPDAQLEMHQLPGYAVDYEASRVTFDQQSWEEGDHDKMMLFDDGRMIFYGTDDPSPADKAQSKTTTPNNEKRAPRSTTASQE